MNVWKTIMIPTAAALLAVIACPVLGVELAPATPGQESILAAPLDACNVVWDSPSENASGSMPLGNGDVGVNAWVETERRPVVPDQQDRRLG